MKPITIRAFLLLNLALAGCTMGPDYVPPQWDLPARYAADGAWKTAQPMDTQPKGPWWHIYQDPQLNQLIDTLNRQSPTISQAQAQYRAAQALLRQTQASQWPTLNTTANQNRGQSLGQAATNTYTIQAAASWELDLWGSTRRLIEANQATQAAQAATLAAIQLSSQAQLATAYLQRSVIEQQLHQQQQHENLLRETLTLTRNRFTAGSFPNRMCSKQKVCSCWPTPSGLQSS